MPFTFGATVVLPIALLLSHAHFWFMEVDYKLKLQIRPFAYIAFIVGAAGLVSVVLQP
jgi:hypothetical protein